MDKPYWSVGLGITNNCNFSCSHCYSRGRRIDNLTFLDIKKLTDALSIKDVNFGTGESFLNPDFQSIIYFLNTRNISMSLTSNGTTVMQLSNEQLTFFNDIDISIEFASEDACDLFRNKGSFKQILMAVDKCRNNHIPVSLACCLMNINYKQIPQLLEFAYRLRTALRINIYKPVRHRQYALDYGEYWNGIKSLLEKSNLISCSEPLISSVLGLASSQMGCNCGKTSFRVNPDRSIVPCVYWNKSDVCLTDLIRDGERALFESKQFSLVRRIPNECHNCNKVEICKGGCAAQRQFYDLSKPDPYCYMKNNNSQPELAFQRNEHSPTYVHGGYLCTLIVEPFYTT